MVKNENNNNMKHEITKPVPVFHNGSDAIIFKINGKNALVTLEHIDENYDLLCRLLGYEWDTERKLREPKYLSEAHEGQLVDVVEYILGEYIEVEDAELDYKNWFRTEAKKRLIRMTMRRITYPYKKQIHEVQN